MGAIPIKLKPRLFEYDDYRQFLRDTYTYLKSEHSYFSYRYFSKRAGFASPNFLKLVIESKRNLSTDSVTRFADALKLTRAETEFFTQLVEFNQATSPSDKSKAAQKMTQSKSFQKIHPLSKAQFAYYSEWYYIPVRELVALPMFNESPEWISRTLFPAIKPEQASQALKDLLSLGLIERTRDGKLKQVQENLNTENEVVSSSLAKYHKKMIQMAGDSIDNVPRQKREISAACVPISKKTVQLLKERIQDFRREILTLACQDEQTELIYQINIQMFPLSNSSEED